MRNYRKRDERIYYQAGNYYDYLKAVIEESLNDFLGDTSFPYTAASGGKGGFGGPGGFGDIPDGEIDGDLGHRNSKGDFHMKDVPEGENFPGGKGDGKGVHFDAVMAELLKNHTEYGAAYAEDLVRIAWVIECCQQ